MRKAVGLHVGAGHAMLWHEASEDTLVLILYMHSLQCHGLHIWYCLPHEWRLDWATYQSKNTSLLLRSLARCQHGSMWSGLWHYIDLEALMHDSTLAQR